MATKVAATKSEGVRTTTAPLAQTIKVVAESGILNAASRHVWKNFWRIGRWLTGIWIG
jgi:hypothetical protein